MWIILTTNDRHVQWLFHVMVMWSYWVIRNLGRDNHMMLKIGLCVGCMKLIWDTIKVKKSH